MRPYGCLSAAIAVKHIDRLNKNSNTVTSNVASNSERIAVAIDFDANRRYLLSTGGNDDSGFVVAAPHITRSQATTSSKKEEDDESEEEEKERTDDGLLAPGLPLATTSSSFLFSGVRSDVFHSRPATAGEDNSAAPPFPSLSVGQSVNHRVRVLELLEGQLKAIGKYSHKVTCVPQLDLYRFSLTCLLKHSLDIPPLVIWKPVSDILPELRSRHRSDAMSWKFRFG